jgi:peroxiredoxin
MRKILILIIPLALLSGCKNNNVVTIGGIINKKTAEYISISRVDVNIIQILDSVKIDKKGNFKFRVKASEPDFYQVGLSPDNFITLLAEPGEKISLIFNNENLFDNYLIEGSKGSELLRSLDDRLLDTRKKLDSLNVVFEKVSAEPGSDTIQNRLTDAAISLVKAQRRFNIEFVINNINSLASIKAIYQKLNNDTYVLYETRDLQYMKILSDSLTRHYPDSRHTKALVKSFEEGLKQMNVARMNRMIDTIPEAKLDPNLKDINGRLTALSSLRGKYVLLTFWVSGSKDCISENLQLKDFYKMFHKKGFEIYQISFDTDESAWRAAVKFDELPWISTREDDPRNQKNAMLFNVKTVPTNYLFDPQGTIIASNLHGKALQLKLYQLFGN